MPWCDHTFVATPTIPVCTKCGQSPHASPSQLEQWIGCRRKHAYNRSRPRRKEQNPAAAFGDRCHKLIEDWLRNHKVPDTETPEGRCVLPALPTMPMPRTPGMVVEHTAKPNLLGVPWFMRMDLVYGYVPRQSICVDDHKTTGDIAKNAKAPEVLRTTDPQGIAYTYWGTTAFDVPRAISTWRYMQRDTKARPRSVIFTITRDEATERFTEMHMRYVLPMVRSRTEPPESFPRDGIANGFCYAFHPGCEHMDECHATLTQEERDRAALVQLRTTA